MIIMINNDNKVIAKASGRIFDNVEIDNVKTFRIDDVPTVSETEELFFNPETKEFYIEAKPVARTLTAEDRKAIREAMQSKEKALKWLADNDWKPNKITRKEWAEDDPRWLEYLDKCAEMRAKIDEAEAILNK